MILWAQQLRDDLGYRERISEDFNRLYDSPSGDSEIEFKVADVLHLNLDTPRFDVITGQRILINLPSPREQMRGLASLRKHATDEAVLILTEATVQGHQRTDSYRATFGLPALEKYWHNVYVDESLFDQWPQVGWRVEQDLSYATYALFSKVIYPAACGPEKCWFLSGANAAAMEVASLFRSREAVEEIGMPALLRAYVKRVERYNKQEADQIAVWIESNKLHLGNWEQIGHQRLIVARAVAPSGNRYEE
jgi:hypothetical protein